MHGHPGILPGADAEVLLRLPGYGEVPLDGVVMRARPVEPCQAQIAVRFAELNADAEDAIASTVERELRRARHPVVVSVGLRRSARRLVDRVARQRGIEPLPVFTPLELIRRLEDTQLRVVAVVMGMHSPRIRPMETVAFLASLYPGVRRILVGDPGWRTREVAGHLLHDLVQPPMRPTRLFAAITGRVLA